jgi:hypothetical protein
MKKKQRIHYVQDNIKIFTKNFNFFFCFYIIKNSERNNKKAESVNVINVS